MPQDGLKEINFLMQKFGVQDDSGHPLLIRFLLPEERMNAEEEEFEIVDGNNRVIVLLQRGITVFQNFNVILNEVDGKRLTWEVSNVCVLKVYF